MLHQQLLFKMKKITTESTEERSARKHFLIFSLRPLCPVVKIFSPGTSDALLRKPMHSAKKSGYDYIDT